MRVAESEYSVPGKRLWGNVNEQIGFLIFDNTLFKVEA